MVKLKDITRLTGKFVKTPNKCAIIDYMLLGWSQESLMVIKQVLMIF